MPFIYLPYLSKYSVTITLLLKLVTPLTQKVAQQLAKMSDIAHKQDIKQAFRISSEAYFLL